MFTEMTLYELTKKYGQGQGESMMWKTVDVISDSVETYMDEKEKARLMRRIYGVMSGHHYNDEFAIEDVANMYYVDDSGDAHYAPYWTSQQVKGVYESVKNSIPSKYNFWDFYVTLQMVKSDLCPMYRGWFPDATPEQMDKRFVESAVNWLNDPDSPNADHKIWSYLND